jgi:hypothetical protein
MDTEESGSDRTMSHGGSWLKRQLALLDRGFQDKA